jgi:hypothetical protein
MRFIGVLSREFVIEMNTNCDVLGGFKQSVALYQEGPLRYPIDPSANWNGDFTLTWSVSICIWF